MGWDDIKPPYLPKALEAMRAVDSDNDLVAILRGHLYVEAVLAEILATNYGGAEPVIARLGFAQKYMLLRHEELITKRHSRLLACINDIRNSFAHLPLKMRITNEDERDLINALDELQRDSVRDLANRNMPNIPEPGRVARMIFKLLVSELYPYTITEDEE